jgi:hypothetical protein
MRRAKEMRAPHVAMAICMGTHALQQPRHGYSVSPFAIDVDTQGRRPRAGDPFMLRDAGVFSESECKP